MRDSLKLFISGLRCVEIGVSSGDNAINMLEAFPFATFFLVDNYDVNNTTFQYGRVYSQEERDNFINKVVERLAPYADRANLMVMESTNASTHFADESLDYVYIDAQHEYEAVLRDLNAWWPKVKRGGVIAGHDISSVGVKRAVTSFFSRAVAYGKDDEWTVSK